MLEQFTHLEIGLAVLCLELLALLVFSVLRSVKGRKALLSADREAAGSLLSRVTAKEETRRDALVLVLRQAYKLDDVALNKFADEFMAREREFYGTVAEVFRERNYERLGDLTEDLNKVVAPCIGLVPPNQVDKDEADRMADELDELERKNLKLKQDLMEQTSNLEQLTNEYNAAFAKANEAGAAKAEAATPAPAEDGPAEAAPADSPDADSPDPLDALVPDVELSDTGVDISDEDVAKRKKEPSTESTGVFDLSADDLDDLISGMGGD